MPPYIGLDKDWPYKSHEDIKRYRPDILTFQIQL